MKKCPICGVPLKAVPAKTLKDAYICDGTPDGPKHVFKLASRLVNGKSTTVLICHSPTNLREMFPVNVAALPS